MKNDTLNAYTAVADAGAWQHTVNVNGPDTDEAEDNALRKIARLTGNAIRDVRVTSIRLPTPTPTGPDEPQYSSPAPRPPGGAMLLSLYGRPLSTSSRDGATKANGPAINAGMTETGFGPHSHRGPDPLWATVPVVGVLPGEHHERPNRQVRRSDPTGLSEPESESVVRLALQVMAKEMASEPVMTGEQAAAKYLQLETGQRERETFGCLFLTTRNRLIRDEELFYRSVDRASVYPRIILQKALAHNAAAIICYHNHPSSEAEPSPSDMTMTSRLKDLLDEINVRLLDHIVVSRKDTVSMAARGLI